jgi:hypothetical protein
MVVVPLRAGEPVRGEGDADQPHADDDGGETIDPVEQDVEAPGARGTLCYAPKHLIARWRQTSI